MCACKKEDEGEIYTTDNNIKCPDYRIVLDDTSRTELLIEVKNHHGKTDFCLSKTYLAELKNYARYIDFSYKPPEQSNADGFEIIGDASSIIAMQYTEQTVENGKVKRISPHLAPDKFGVSFSENYHSDELPIWRFYIQPSE